MTERRESAKLGVGVVGAGAMGQHHAACWQQVPGAEVVAVADALAPLAEQLARQCGLASSHTDFRVAIARPEVDVVSICVPTHLHPEIAIFAAGQGKHILCEKPIALTLAEAEAMIAAAEENGVTLSIGLMRRYSPVLGALREWLAEGRLGRPVLYQATMAMELRPKRAMHDAQANGGPIIDMGVHFFDQWAFLFEARPVEVYAQGLKLAEHRPELAHIAEIATDTATITVRYASGDIGTFVVCWGLPPGTKPLLPWDQIFGAKGLAQLMLYGRRHELQVMQDGLWQTIAVAEGDVYQWQLDHFAQALRSGQPPLVSGAAGRAALAVAVAALESVRSGRPVTL